MPRTIQEIRDNAAVGMHSPADTHTLLAEIDKLSAEPAALHAQIDAWREKYLAMLSERDALQSRIANAEAASASARDALMFALATQQFKIGGIPKATPIPQADPLPAQTVGGIAPLPTSPTPTWWKRWVG